MASKLTGWVAALNKMQTCMTKNLEEIRKQKREIQQLKDDIYSRLAEGTYIRNDHRIILSAPEIVIGNVDDHGMLFGDTGSVVVRGGSVSLEGSGDMGSVSTRAPYISQKAVDPGADGVQEAVVANSSIVSQAKSIVIQSNESEGYFSQSPISAGSTGVRIHADESLEIDVTKSVKLRGDSIKDSLTALEKEKMSLTIDVNKKMVDMAAMTAEMEALFTASDLLNTGELMTRANVMDLSDAQDQFETMVPVLHNSLENCIRTISVLAETNRRITALKKEQKKLEAAKSDFEKESIGTRLAVRAERMDFLAVDGDGNIRTTPDALVNIQTGRLNLSTCKVDGSLIDNSGVHIATKDVMIDTTDSKLDKDGNGDLPVMGSFTVNAKNVLFSSVDNKVNNGKSEVVEQTKNSSFTVQAENTLFYSTDFKEEKNSGTFSIGVENVSMGSVDKDKNTTGKLTVQMKEMALFSEDKDKNASGAMNIKVEKMGVAAVDKGGKAIGQIALNGKNVFVMSMDVDDKGKDKNLASGGNMVLVAEKMFMGRTAKKNTAKVVQISADKTGLYGNSTTEVQQGEGKSMVQLDSGNLSISGSKTQLYGDTTVNAKAEFKADVKAPKLTADNLEAKTSFKSANISDGFAVPGAPSTASLSAKLKEEDAPEAV